MPKNWCLQIVVLEKTLASPLDSKEIKPVNPKGNQSWIFSRRTNAEPKAQVLWPPDVKNWLIGKEPDAGRDWGQEEKGMTEDELVGWHHWLNGHGFGWTPGVGDGQGSLACYSAWGCRVGHIWVIELNWSISLIFSHSSWRAHRLELLHHFLNSEATEKGYKGKTTWTPLQQKKIKVNLRN